MNTNQKIEFVRRKKLSKGGAIKRKKYALGNLVSNVGSGVGAGAAAGSIIPGVGNVVGGILGGIGGLLGGIFGGGPPLPNITDPVTGQQITDAQGKVIATQEQLNNFASTLQGVNGVQNQQAVLQNLQQVAAGRGPNPALAQLAQTTGQNIAAQQALQAGQRGAAGNVGLIARQAGQQGANIQQQAVGQGATLAAQQELNALNSMGTIAGQQVGETQNALATAGSLGLQNQGQLLSSQGQYNSQIAGGQANVNTTNAALTGATLPLVQGTLSGAGTAQVANNSPTSTPGGSGLDFSGANGLPSQQIGGFNPLPNAPTFEHGGRVMKGPHKSHVANYLMMAKGGQVPEKVPALVSPGEIYLAPDHVKEVQHGANPLKLGHRIPGKAKVKGDSLKNDTVKATLEEGGVVLPRHIVNSMSPDKAKLFVLKSLAKKKAHQNG